MLGKTSSVRSGLLSSVAKWSDLLASKAFAIVRTSRFGPTRKVTASDWRAWTKASPAMSAMTLGKVWQSSGGSVCQMWSVDKWAIVWMCVESIEVKVS